MTEILQQLGAQMKGTSLTRNKMAAAANQSGPPPHVVIDQRRIVAILTSDLKSPDTLTSLFVLFADWRKFPCIDVKESASRFGRCLVIGLNKSDRYDHKSISSESIYLFNLSI